MSRFKGLAARARSLFGADRPSRGWKRSSAFHVEMETTRLVEREGLSPSTRRGVARSSRSADSTRIARRCATVAARGGSTI